MIADDDIQTMDACVLLHLKGMQIVEKLRNVVPTSLLQDRFRLCRESGTYETIAICYALLYDTS